MCRCWEAEWSKDYLDDEQLIKSIKDLNDLYEVNNIVLTGGEPLLRKNLDNIIKICKKMGLKTTLTTNGSLLDINMIDRFLESGLDIISLSLDSLDPNKHDEIRGVKGAFNKAMGLIDVLSKNKKIHLTLITTIMKDNIDEIPNIIDWVENHDTVCSVTFQVLSTPPNYSGEENWMDHKEFKNLIVTDKTKINFTFSKLISYKNQKYNLGNSIKQLWFFWDYMLKGKFSSMGVCHVDEKAVFVDETGNLRVCPYMNPVVNVKSDNFKKVLSEPYSNNLINQIRNCKVNCNSRINCLARN